VALQPAFFHNGCMTSLEAAIRHHLDAAASARGYAFPADLARDLTAPMGPIESVLAALDSALVTPKSLTDAEVGDLVAFVGGGLLDERATPANLRKLIPPAVPSGRPVLTFEEPVAPVATREPSYPLDSGS
jgi:hypothetical protein